MYAGRFCGLAAQAVDDPAPQRRPAGDARDAAVEVADRDLVAVVPGVHRADDADVVDDPGRVRQQLGDLGAALAVLGELPRAAEQLLARPVDEAVVHVAAVVRAAVLASVRAWGRTDRRATARRA